MMDKTYIPEGEIAPTSQIGATIEALVATIEARRHVDPQLSYTRMLLDAPVEKLCKKVSEESLETCLAAKETEMLAALSTGEDQIDMSLDHLRYEAADVIYHLLVLMERFDIPLDELAAELNARMREEERPQGAVLLHEEHIRRGK